MAKCNHCKREVTGRHDCEPKKGILDTLTDTVGDILDAITSGGDGDSGCDSGGGCD